eukprot:11706193-Karenia_brevis.AAC.3
METKANVTERCRESSLRDAFKMINKANLTDRCRRSSLWEAVKMVKRPNLTHMCRDLLRLGCC